jgi:hypothetical protein
MLPSTISRFSITAPSSCTSTPRLCRSCTPSRTPVLLALGNSDGTGGTGAAEGDDESRPGRFRRGSEPDDDSSSSSSSASSSGSTSSEISGLGSGL